MNTLDAKRLLNDFKRVKYAKTTITKPKKRKDETDKDFIFRINGYRCRYTNRVLPKNKLALVTLYPERTTIHRLKNLGCACLEYALMKGDMNDIEFKKHLSSIKKDVRKEAYEYSSEIKSAVFKRHNYKCIYCEYEYGFTSKQRILTIDHKIPVSRGGTNDIARNFKNLACSCKEHNLNKKDLTAPEYFKVLERRKLRNAELKNKKSTC